ncbi:MAG TPA: universal stress protein [Gaiellaceae bacterium]|nr:universal stress protein [Gaiellaceae bacterium]
MNPKQMIIATDGSPGAREALSTGLSIAAESGAAVTLTYVRQKPLPIVGDPFYGRSLSQELMRARTVLADASVLAAEYGVEAETEVLEGDAAHRVLELARDRNADLIVVGSRGRGMVTGALLGSVSSSIVHDADRPVLVVKQRSRARRAA